MKNRNRLAFIPTLCVIIIGLSVASCSTPKLATGKFDLLSESSQTVLDGTSETFTRIERLQRVYIVETEKFEKYTPESFSADKRGINLTPELRYRETALEVLLRYFLVLQAFAEYDFAGDIDRASIELAGSLEALSGTSAPDNAELTDGMGMLASVVNAAGRAAVDSKRVQNLDEVMGASQEFIAKLAKLTSDSNEKIKLAVDVMLGRILEHRNLTKPKKKSHRRFAYDMKVADIIDETREIKNALDQLSAAINKIPDAHAEVHLSLKNPETGLEALKSLVGEAVRIHVFYRTLDKNIDRAKSEKNY